MPSICKTNIMTYTSNSWEKWIDIHQFWVSKSTSSAQWNTPPFDSHSESKVSSIQYFAKTVSWKLQFLHKIHETPYKLQLGLIAPPRASSYDGKQIISSAAARWMLGSWLHIWSFHARCCKSNCFFEDWDQKLGWWVHFHMLQNLE